MKPPRKRKQFAQGMKQLSSFFAFIIEYIIEEFTKDREEMNSFIKKMKEKESLIRDEEERYSLGSGLRDYKEEQRKREDALFTKKFLIYALFVTILIISQIVYTIKPDILIILSDSISHFANQFNPVSEWTKLQQDSQTSQKDKFAALIEIGKLVISLFGTAATVVGGFMLILNFRVANRQARVANQQAGIAQARFVTETFSKAVEQIERSDRSSACLAAIYSLERIYNDSPSTYWMVINYLTAFVRDRSPLSTRLRDLYSSGGNRSAEEVKRRRDEEYRADYLDTTDRQPSREIAAILLILGKPSQHKEAFLHEIGYIDLSKTDLVGAQINFADFRKCVFLSTDFRASSFHRTHFEGADLREADFRWTELLFTDFTKANLAFAKFNEAKLTRAEFNEAKLLRTIFNHAALTSSTFHKADLRGATFHYADLNGVTFDEAILSKPLDDGRIFKADFRRAKNLDLKKIKKAFGWEQALYDDDFQESLGLPKSS
jgi:uncharacterized protein YjbI with pentapeptide repeats